MRSFRTLFVGLYDFQRPEKVENWLLFIIWQVKCTWHRFDDKINHGYFRATIVMFTNAVDLWCNPISGQFTGLCHTTSGKMVGCESVSVWIQQSSPCLCPHVFACCCCCFQSLHGKYLTAASRCSFQFALSLLGSHDNVSLCVTLLNKIRFVNDFVQNYWRSSKLMFEPHHIFTTSVLCPISGPL